MAEYVGITTPGVTEVDPDVTLNNEVLRVLHRHYPDYGWFVDVPKDQGVVIVKNLDLIGNKPWGFVLKRAMMDADLKCVMRAGGELLERYKRFRRGFRIDEYVENLHKQRFAKPEM